MIAGRYSLEREIGRGGMGAVWLGIDEVLEREVALKRIGLLPGADSTDLARAEREARLAARLDHPNVVAVFNLVADADTDSRWLVMEYVDGTNLSRLVQERRAALARRRGTVAAADGGRPGRGPCRGHRAPGREAVEHPGGPRPAGEADRLRHRPDRDGPGPDADRPGHRVARVPAPGGRLR